ncbi:MAG: hypothetical protein GXY83_06595 [Rhodopirellula sp.]|nr:hypothetical protein [Rhodopirellula sp.]
MEESFDPYYKWLGIAPEEQPPSHYRLLGINAFENDPDVISSAADRQMAHVRTYQTGPHSDASQRILNELAAARLCLLDAVSRMAYNYELRARLSERSAARQPDDAFAQSVRGAVRYASLEFQRRWLSISRLPAAYLALGRDVTGEGRFRDELSDQYGRLDEILRRYQSLRPRDDDVRSEAEPQQNPGARWPQWLSAVVGTLRLWFGTAVYHYRRRAVLRGIGRAAYAAHRGESGPDHLAGRIGTMQSRLADLESRLEELAEVPPGQFLSPQRTAWLLGVILLLPILLLLWLL